MAGVSASLVFDRAVRGNVARGLKAAAVFLAARCRETLGKPAPKRRARSRRGGVYYRASVPATPGAAPRLLTARLRNSVTWEADPARPSARVGTNVVYGRVHEEGAHPWLAATAARHRAEAAAVCARAASA